MIQILLIIAGVESNPGPRKKRQSITKRVTSDKNKKIKQQSRKEMSEISIKDTGRKLNNKRKLAEEDTQNCQLPVKKPKYDENKNHLINPISKTLNAKEELGRKIERERKRKMRAKMSMKQKVQMKEKESTNRRKRQNLMSTNEINIRNERETILRRSTRKKLTPSQKDEIIKRETKGRKNIRHNYSTEQKKEQI